MSISKTNVQKYKIKLNIFTYLVHAKMIALPTFFRSKNALVRKKDFDAVNEYLRRMGEK